MNRAPTTAPPLHGRAVELATVERLLAAARTGRSAALVVRGEAGIGKSALLAYATAAATGMRVLAQTGVETEAELPYAALHALLRSAGAELDGLPDAQADALRVALGLAAGPPPDRFLVGLAVLTLLAELAADRPVLCVLDDAHWIDRASAQVLLFAARRLGNEAVVVLVAARTGLAPDFPAPGLPELTLSRLDDAAARAMLDAEAGDLPRRVRDQLLREAAGNPLALRELPAAHRAGRAPVYPLAPPEAGRGGVAPTGSPVEREFAARIAALPAAARTALLVAAADGTCDTGVVLAAAERLGATPADLEVLERERLLTFTSGCMGFHHPLIRTAVYGAATLPAKRAAHAALAEVLDERREHDRRNWHLAASSFGPDERVATALEESAVRARERGSHEAVAAAYERAAALTAPGPEWVRRMVAGTEAAAEVGHREWVGRLIGSTTPHARDPAHRARLALVEARLADEADEPELTHRLLLDAVGPAASAAPRLANEMLLWAVEAGWSARDRGMVERVLAVAEDLDLPDRAHLRAHVAMATAQLEDDPDVPLPPARVALAEVAGCQGPGAPRPTASLAGWHLVTGDDAAALALAAAAERESRATGALGALPRVLSALAASRWHLGHWNDAAAAAADGLSIARDIGQDRAVGGLVVVQAHLAAATGDEVGLAAALAEVDGRRPTAASAGTAASARGLLDLGAGRFDVAADRLAEAVAGPGRPRALPGLVEAAVRAGRPEQARAAARRFTRWAEHTGQAWARAVALRCRALVAPDDAAEALFAEAVALHRLDGAHLFARARTELLLGEWLRRARRRSEARAPLRTAADAFAELGARPWAERAHAELRATGETRATTAPDCGALAELTPQELQVVRLAAAGLSNRDIGAQLFLSPRTVGYHLYKAFPKLGVASRAQLPGGWPPLRSGGLAGP
ncbi:helix-turn-helix transcriptional regulator [Pseudonocardia kunmingensis]|uniref:Regulatory LuxR family protein n=1 Tax=Pseudonocardia kunmingensis TaxID=630975 RepID=A0A543E0Y9_9PSEU|nr:LuxR family transcriptional regulator [Pseudonocardia kunmingensis]TQM15253.1 regulatory LuxR family protein [Pseudonocardia kunmingensis]